MAGAFVAAAPEVIETLVQNARTYVYTTALPPLLAHTLLTSLGLIRAEEWRRGQLRSHIAALKSGLARSRWKLLPSDTAIQPLVIGANDAAMAVAKALESEGLLVPAIRPPTVPAGTARLRISVLGRAYRRGRRAARGCAECFAMSVRSESRGHGPDIVLLHGWAWVPRRSMRGYDNPLSKFPIIESLILPFF